MPLTDGIRAVADLAVFALVLVFIACGKNCLFGA